MAETTGEDLRALIRLIPPARALGKELEKMMQMEIGEGIGHMALKNFKGLLDSVVKLTDDAYPATLVIDLPLDAGEKQKIGAVMLANSQLIAYLEAQAGVTGRQEEERKKGDNVVVNLQGARLGDMAEGFEKMGEMFSKMFGGTKFGEEFARKFEETFGKKGKKEEPEQKQ